MIWFDVIIMEAVAYQLRWLLILVKEFPLNMKSEEFQNSFLKIISNISPISNPNEIYNLTNTIWD
jgi:hypothetical protein